MRCRNHDTFPKGVESEKRDQQQSITRRGRFAIRVNSSLGVTVSIGLASLAAWMVYSLALPHPAKNNSDERFPSKRNSPSRSPANGGRGLGWNVGLTQPPGLIAVLRDLSNAIEARNQSRIGVQFAHLAQYASEMEPRICAEYLVECTGIDALEEYLSSGSQETRTPVLRDFDYWIAQNMVVIESNVSASAAVLLWARLSAVYGSLEGSCRAKILVNCVLQNDRQSYSRFQEPHATDLLADLQARMHASDLVYGLLASGMSLDHALSTLQHFEPSKAALASVLGSLFAEGYPEWLGHPRQVAKLLGEYSPQLRQECVRAKIRSLGNEVGSLLLEDNPWLTEPEQLLVLAAWSGEEPRKSCQWAVETGSEVAFSVAFRVYLNRHSRGASEWLISVEDSRLRELGARMMVEYLEADGNASQADSWNR